MFNIDEFPGRAFKINGKEHLYFGGTSYLGLQTDTAFQSFFIKNIKKYGTAYSASRKSNIRLSIFDETETYLANLVRSNGCITTSSGYLAGQLVCDYFNHSDYQLYYAPNTHSALLQGGQKMYNNWEHLINDVVKNHGKTKVVFLDSIDFNGANYPDFKTLQELPLEDIILVVDDSHGIGITGVNGGGSYHYLQSLKPKELLVSCSLGKGFGIQAGAIFSSQSMIDKLKATSIFGGSSPATPASLATLLDAEHLIARKRTLLHRNMELFRTNISKPSLFFATKGHPTFSFQNKEIALELETNGIVVTNFSYPTEDDVLMSRIVISASHTTRDIARLYTILNAF